MVRTGFLCGESEEAQFAYLAISESPTRPSSGRAYNVSSDALKRYRPFTPHGDTNMATQSHQAAPVSRKITGIPEMDAIALLKQDHQNVKELFEQYEALSDRSLASKRKLALKICLELSKHAMAEEEIFYPAVREANKNNEDLIDEAIVEHASAKELIAQIVAMQPGEDLYDAKVKIGRAHV